MALIIGNPQRSFGEEFGQSLAGGLNKYASKKLEQLHFSDALKQNNYSDAQIALLNQLAPKDRLEALQSLSPGGRGQQQQEQQQVQQQPQSESQASGLMNRIQGLGEKPQPLSQSEAMQAFNDNKLNQMGMGGQQQQGAGPSVDVQTLLNEAAKQGMTLTDEQKQKLARKVQEIYSDQGKRKALEEDVMKYVNQQQARQGNTQQQGQSALQEPLQSGSPFKKPLSAADRIAQQRLGVSERKELQREKEHAFSATANLRKEIGDKAKAARDRLEDIKLQRQLDDSGKLDSAGYVEFLKRADLDIPALLNPESQLYNKIAQGYQRDAKTLYGGQVTNNEIDQLMRAVPTLSSSRKGRQLLYPVLERFQDDQIAYENAEKAIIKENRGVPPLDLQEQISDRIAPMMKKNAEKVRAEIQRIVKYVEDDENPLTTALQATAGELVGGLKKAVPGAAKGALKGAVAGSFIPGLGTTGGAILGGLGGASGLI